jgi:hypothetical protein
MYLKLHAFCQLLLLIDMNQLQNVEVSFMKFGSYVGI